MSLNVIGAGVGRTGSYSLKLALNQLGLGPYHHMEEVLHQKMNHLRGPLSLHLNRACACRKSDSWVAMMQPADHGLSNDPAKTLDGADDRSVLSQGQMRAGLVVYPVSES